MGTLRRLFRIISAFATYNGADAARLAGGRFPPYQYSKEQKDVVEKLVNMPNASGRSVMEHLADCGRFTGQPKIVMGLTFVADFDNVREDAGK